VLSADLAREGFTGASRILEGERGFFRAMSTAFDERRVTDGLGERWKISENCYKMHSCCGHTHTAIDVTLGLRRAGAVRSVEIETYGPGYEIVKERNPRTSYQAKFSIAYCVAAAWREGRVGLAQFSPDRFDALAQLLERTQVRVADDLTAKYPAAWPARVTVTMEDGAVLRGASDFPRGNPENAVSTAELEEKFAALAGDRRGIERVRGLEDVRDMAEVFQDL
jgi:2-methylcitrate dehydratase PrpD